MKALFFVLFLAVGTVICQQQPVTQLSAADIQNNATIQYIANFGAQNVAQEAIKVGDLPNGLYNISRVYGASQQSVTDGVNYIFDTQLTSQNGNSARASYTVLFNTTDNDYDVTSFVYERAPGLNNVLFGNQDLSDSDIDFSGNQALLGADVLIAEESAEFDWLGAAWTEDDYNNELAVTEELNGDYSPVDLAGFNNDQEAQDLLVFGLQDVINEVADRGDLDDDYPFEITQIYNVSEQVGGAGNYEYDLAVNNRNGSNARLLFVVNPATATNAAAVQSYEYVVNTTDNNRRVVLGSSSGSPSADNALTDETDTDDDNNNNVGGYTRVDPAQANDNSQIQDAQESGAQYVVQQGIAVGAIPAGQYRVTQTNSVYQQVVNGINYRFNTTISNDQGSDLVANYVVYSQPSTNTQRVSAFKFRY